MSYLMRLQCYGNHIVHYNITLKIERPFFDSNVYYIMWLRKSTYFISYNSTSRFFTTVEHNNYAFYPDIFGKLWSTFNELYK
jgi:hypothetical protein